MPAASATRATLGYAGAEQRCNECPHRRGELLGGPRRVAGPRARSVSERSNAEAEARAGPRGRGRSAGACQKRCWPRPGAGPRGNPTAQRRGDRCVVVANDHQEGADMVRHPTLYQLNSRVLLAELGRKLRRRASLDDLPDAMIEQAATRGFEWIWPLGVWQTGAAAREISRTRPSLRESYAHDLPDWRDDDVVGSPFAIQAYDVNRDFGGDVALARLRQSLARAHPKPSRGFRP